MELYVHIPFCRRKCRYCSFTSYAGQKAYYEEYVRLLLKEAENRIKEADEPIRTVYIGGGTPSLLPPVLLRKLSAGLKRIYELERLEEFTVEANPGTVSREWVDTAAEMGITRLSFGMQAYQDELLEVLGRIHRYEEVRYSVETARKAGINDISLDLMFGIPAQSRTDWTETLEAATALSPDHISAYGLIPEEGTPLYRELEECRLSLPEPEEERQMYDDAIRFLQRRGFHQYEISNFALKSHECRHNIGYWTQVPYIGLGVSSASMTGFVTDHNGISYIRTTNTDSLEEYSGMISGSSVIRTKEIIGPEEARFETMMLGLRMNRGVDEESFFRMHRKTMEECYGTKLHGLERKGLLIHENGSWKMTRRGFDIQNSILVELME